MMAVPSSVFSLDGLGGGVTTIVGIVLGGVQGKFSASSSEIDGDEPCGTAKSSGDIGANEEPDFNNRIFLLEG